MERRRKVARRYDEAFAKVAEIIPLDVNPDVLHAYHLYVIRLQLNSQDKARNAVFRSLRQKGIGVNVHYIPVHLHPFYQKEFGTKPGLCPVAECAYEQILSLPISAAITDEQTRKVISALKETIAEQQI